MVTRSPRILRRRPRELAVSPLPSELTTPPVTKICLGNWSSVLVEPTLVADGITPYLGRRLYRVNLNVQANDGLPTQIVHHLSQSTFEQLLVLVYFRKHIPLRRQEARPRVLCESRDENERRRPRLLGG